MATKVPMATKFQWQLRYNSKFQWQVATKVPMAIKAKVQCRSSSMATKF